LPAEKAQAVFGKYWREILDLTLQVSAGRLPSCAAPLSPEEYEGALYLYGSNGPSVYLFFAGLQIWEAPDSAGLPESSARDILRVEDPGSLPDPTVSRYWGSALLESGYRKRGGTLGNVSETGMKLGLEIGGHTMKMLIAASAGELAQMPQKDLHFFLDMMPWIRAGQLPCNWDDASNRLVVERLEPGHSDGFLRDLAHQRFKENLWPTPTTGMRVMDDEAFARAARSRGHIILVCDASPARLQYIGRPGYRPRPPDLSGRIRRQPPHVGLLSGELGEAGLPDGYSLSPESEGLLVRDHAGNAFYEGYCLHGVYTMEGKSSYSEAFRREMNQRLGTDLIQAGPLDLLRVDSRDRRPRPPVTAYMPDRAPVRLLTRQEMKRFYEDFDISWADMYPEDQSCPN
jgi:hypothetical protein